MLISDSKVDGNRFSSKSSACTVEENFSRSCLHFIGHLFFKRSFFSRQAIDYTIPFYKDNGIAIMMQKSKDTIAFWFFLTILDYEVWLNFAVAFFVTSILMYVFGRYSPLGRKNAPENCKPDSRFASLRDCFWFCLTSITPHNCGPLPENPSGKLVAAVWWLFVFVIAAVYNANLGANLTLYQLERRIETIDDLRRQYQVEYSTVVNSPTYKYFESLKTNEEFLSE